MRICSCLYSKIQEFSFLYLLLRIFKIFRQLIFFGQVRFRKKYKLLTHLCKNKDQTVLLNSFYYRALQLKFYYEEKHVYYEAKSRNLSLLHHTNKMHPKHKFRILHAFKYYFIVSDLMTSYRLQIIWKWKCRHCL